MNEEVPHSASVPEIKHDLAGLEFPVIGVGASAGGLEAFTRLLRALPEDPGVALVFVQHLDPHRESLLVPILAQVTSLTVSHATDGEVIRPNHVYVIPPDKHLLINAGRLSLVPRGEASLPNLPIDIFFQSLAADRQNRSIAVVLSGGGSDGSRGIEAVHAAGGLTLAQNEESSIHSSMPRNAVMSGCVDIVLTPEEIAVEVIRLTRSIGPFNTSGEAKELDSLEDLDLISRILTMMRSRKGVDFSQYKQTTIHRRILRRMSLLGIDDGEEFANRLQAEPALVEALYQDCLLRVTSFFRDPEAFAALERSVLADLFRKSDSPVHARIWVPGCSTGEEAYSIAMLLVEHLGDRVDLQEIKILATDVNEAVLAKARTGIFPETIATDLSADRLRRFFRPSGNQYRIVKSIRDLCIFARHNLLTDPPFARIDLISCRNVLIYFNAAAQNRVMPMFHYALRPGGHLLLGPSETIGGFRDLFDVIDAENRLYLRKNSNTRAPLDLIASGLSARGTGSTLSSGLVVESSGLVEVQREADRILSRYAPPGVLVNENLFILQFRGETGTFLRNPPGLASLELLRMASEGLLKPLRESIGSARASGRPARCGGGSVYSQGETRNVTIHALPLQGTVSGLRCILIIFEEESRPFPKEKPDAERPIPLSEDEAAERLDQLQQELDDTREHLQTVVEEHTAALEEVKSANEELLASNEELQSTNEEIQSAKEELQSTNEEIETTNDELRTRNCELGFVNSDLANLLSGVNVPIVMVNRELKLRRFATKAEKLFNLYQADIGRSLAEIRPNFDCPELVPTIKRVIDTLESASIEIRDGNGSWYLLRIRPYETEDNRIDGAVMTAIDIDSLKRTEEQLREARDFNASILDTVQQSLVVVDSNAKILRANPAFFRTFRVLPSEIPDHGILEVGGRQLDTSELRSLLERALHGDKTDEIEVTTDLPETGIKTLRLAARQIRQSVDEPPLVLFHIDDITEKKRMEMAARDLEIKSINAKRLESLGIMAGGIAHDLNNILTPIIGYADLLDFTLPATAVEAHSMAKDITTNARRAADLVQQILAYSGKGRFVIEPVRLSRLVRDMSSLLRASMGPGIALKYELDQVDAFVVGDPTQLSQVVLNLAINAAESYESGTGTVVVRTSTVLADSEMLRSPFIDQDLSPGRYTLLEVEDKGAGIPEEIQGQVFEPFFSTKFCGRGMGLAAVLGIVKGHAGSIQIISTPGHGTLFRVFLPCMEEETRPLPEPLSSLGASGSERWQGTGTVLVVDDESSVRELAVAFLKSLGFDVLQAENGVDAIKEFERHPEICLALIDLTMPGKSGMEIASEMQKRRPGIRVVVMSGFIVTELVKEAKGMKFDGALQKPFTRDSFVSIVRDVLTERKNASDQAVTGK